MTFMHLHIFAGFLYRMLNKYKLHFTTYLIEYSKLFVSIFDYFDIFGFKVHIFNNKSTFYVFIAYFDGLSKIKYLLQ